jgi:radical SAM superfamily enzyme YgiQ (UPF0313 family)
MQLPRYVADVQLINVARKVDMHHLADFPYGMALITAYLRELDFKTLLIQYPIWKKEEYLKEILDNPAYLYGFQVGCDNNVEIRNLVSIIKEKNPSAKIIYGGPFVVDLYKEILANDANVDAIVLGEGEYTTAEMIKLLKEGSPDWKMIHGLAWLDDDGKIVVNPHRPAIKDLDAMPFAARDGVRDESHDIEGKYMRDVRITTSRGCTSNCTFCAVNLNSKLQKTKRWRGRDPIKVVDEIQFLVENYNVKMLNFQDSAFDDPGTLGPKRNRVFCEEILRRGLEVSMKVYYRAHPVDDSPEDIELYMLYKEAGIDVIIIGVEAGSDYELELYGKKAKAVDNYRSLRVMRELNLFLCHVGIINFGPYTTVSTLRENYRFLHENQQFYYYHNFDSSLMLSPGAAICESMRKEGRIILPKNYWDYPGYEFSSPGILKLAEHYQELRKIYSHLDVGAPLMLNAENLISRLKNKMNKKVAVGCQKEIGAFLEQYYKSKSTINELGYQGAMENLERIEKDGLRADLVGASDPYYGKNWGNEIYSVEAGYATLLASIQRKGFGLAGLVFNSVNPPRSISHAEEH